MNPLHRTMRSDCPSFIMLRAAKCGQKLEVIGVCNQHNHPISESDSRSLPQNRRLPQDVRSVVLQMLRMNIHRKKIIEYVHRISGKMVTSKDLLNLRASSNRADAGSDGVSKETKQELLDRIQAICSSETEPAGNELEVEAAENEDPHETVRYYEMIESDNDPATMVTEAKQRQLSDEMEQVIEETIIGDESYAEFNGFQIEMAEPNDPIDCVELVSDEESDMEEESLMPQGIIMMPECEIFPEEQNEVESSLPQIPMYTALSPTPPSPIPSEKLAPTQTPDTELFAIDSKRTRKKVVLRKKSSPRYSAVTRRPRVGQSCKHCGLNAKLVQMQIAVLKAEKEKLVEETEILRLTKERLMMETGIACVPVEDAVD